MNSLDTRALAEVHKALVEDLNAIYEQLGSGTQLVRDDASASGMNCARFIGKIDGLKLALIRIQETSDDLSSSNKSKKKEAA